MLSQYVKTVEGCYFYSMSKRFIVGLAFFMAFVLLGLIYVQYKWINLAFKVNEEHFDQIVRRALTDAVRNLEAHINFNSFFEEYYASQTDSLLSMYNPSAQDGIANPGNDIKASLSIRSTVNGQVIDTNITFSVDPKGNVKNLQRKISLNDKYINNEEMRQQLVKQMLQSSLYSYKGIESRVNNQIIVELVEKALEDYGIDINFEYALTNQSAITNFVSQNFNPEVEERIYRVRVFPDDFFDATNYLTVYFPKRKQFIYKDLGYIGGTSVLLIFLIVGTFIFTLFVIFRQKKLSEIKNDFVNNMTHELKTPISTISLASQMLGDKNIPTESKNLDRISGIIAQESKRLGYLVERVLQAAVFNQGRMNLKLAEYNLHELIESSIENFSIQVDTKGGMIIPSLHAEYADMMVDKVHFSNILSNLLDNALKYCDKVPEIFVETRNAGNKLIITVRDNGMGISKADQNRIFDRFFRVTTGNVHNIKGFGLGLSYVRKVVEEHNGTISIDSELGKGSAFTIELPITTKKEIEEN